MKGGVKKRPNAGRELESQVLFWEVGSLGFPRSPLGLQVPDLAKGGVLILPSASPGGLPGAARWPWWLMPACRQGLA